MREASAAEQVRTVAAVQWEPLYQQGLQLGNQGDLGRAEQYMAAALQRGGPPERILPALLRVCTASQRYRAAIEYANPFLETHSDAWSLRYVVATIHLGLGEPLSAKRQLELVLLANPRHAEAHFALASVLRDDLSDAGTADEHFRRYLELEPDGAHAREARAGLLTRVRQ